MDEHEIKQGINQSTHSRIATTWIALAVFVIILLLLLIFILQNDQHVRIHYLGLSGNLPFGVAVLLAAVAGVILTLLIGSARIVQLKLARRQQHEPLQKP